MIRNLRQDISATPKRRLECGVASVAISLVHLFACGGPANVRGPSDGVARRAPAVQTQPANRHQNLGADARVGHTPETSEASKDESSSGDLQQLAALASSQRTGRPLESEEDWPQEIRNFSREVVLKALGIVDDRDLKLRARREDASSKFTIATLQRRSAPGEQADQFDMRVFVIRDVGGRLVRDAEGRAELPKSSCQESDGSSMRSDAELTILRQDFTLGSSKRAIGLSLTCAVSGPSWSGEETNLMLLEDKAPALVQVFSLRTRYDIFDRVSQSNLIESSSVAFVSRDGGEYFDLKVELRSERHIVRGGKDLTEPIKNSERRMARVGERYVEMNTVK